MAERCKGLEEWEKNGVGMRGQGKANMISSVHPASMMCVDHLDCSKEKPLVVHKYNQSMGGVDEADQYGVYYSFDRKSVK